MSEFVEINYVREFFKGKRVCIVGGGPSVFENVGTRLDAYDILVRVSNYVRQDERTGSRCDVHYSFYGSSIGKKVDELKKDGVKLCMCKCPNGQPIPATDWHIKNKKMEGVDYRYIYKLRKDFWFCPTYIPTKERFLKIFNLLDQHQPTTGFACIMEIIDCEPNELYLTGFDFFTSNKHFNAKGELINWGRHDKNKDDPYRHEPEAERKILSGMVKSRPWVTFDKILEDAMNG